MFQSFHNLHTLVFLKLGNLLNDLTLFKTAKGELELRIRKEELFINIVSIILTIFIALFTVATNRENIRLITDGFINMVVTAMFLGVLYKITTSKRNYYGKLETVSNAIYILESIKEDIDKNPIEIPETRKFEVEVDNLEDQASEPRKYSINVNEILENEIHEGTIESKNKSIEIKINL